MRRMAVRMEVLQDCAGRHCAVLQDGVVMRLQFGAC
jgi:hypothetical protein